MDCLLLLGFDCFLGATLSRCHVKLKRSLKDVQWFKGLVHFQNKNVLIMYSLVILSSDPLFFEENVPGFFSIYRTLMLAIECQNCRFNGFYMIRAKR